MNLDDLRAHLQNQATEIAPATPVPLPTIHRRAKSIKRRRAAAVITSAAAAVAVALAILPGAINNSAPDPVKPPPDYTRDGITIPGAVGLDRLEKAEIGKPGAGPLQFNWTPSGTRITFRPYCRTTPTKALEVQVTVNGRVVARDRCIDSGPLPVDGFSRSPGHLLWVEAPPGKAAEVRVFVTDGKTHLEDASAAQLALGIYRSPEQATTSAFPAEAGLPVRTLPADPGDYLKDGIRFRAKAAGDTLLGAAVGEAGQRSLKLRFTATSESTGLRMLCTADKGSRAPQEPVLSVRIDGQPPLSDQCFSGHADVVQEDTRPYGVQVPAGQTVEVTIDLVDKQGREITVPGARIGIGAYSLQPPRLIDTKTGTVIDEMIEHGDYTYKLAKVVTMDATSRRALTLDTPAGKPYIVGYGYGLNDNAEPAIAQVDGLSQQLSFRLGQMDNLGPAKLTGSFGQPPREAGQATLKIREGRPTKGVLYLALYLPES